MPVSFTRGRNLNLASIAIFNDIFLARLDHSSPFSYIKKSTAHDLNVFDGHFMIMLPISYRNKPFQCAVEIYDQLADEIVLGTYVISNLNIISLQLQ